MLSADDRFAILDVIARYNRLADERKVEETIAVYTDDGFIEGDFSTGPGPDGLRADLPGIFAMEGTLKRHLSANHIIEGDGERATVRSLLVVVEGETMPGVGATADITDELRLIDGSWKVARHHVAIDPSMRFVMQAQSSSVIEQASKQSPADVIPDTAVNPTG